MVCSGFKRRSIQRSDFCLFNTQNRGTVSAGASSAPPREVGSRPGMQRGGGAPPRKQGIVVPGEDNRRGRETETNLTRLMTPKGSADFQERVAAML